MKMFLTDLDIADRYSVNRCWAWRAAKKGQFPPPIKLSGGVTRWRSQDVEAHEAKQAEKAA